MLSWLQTIFCSTQILDINSLLDLENTLDFLKAFEKKELCENEEIEQKSQDLTKTKDKNFYENQSNSNLLDDLTNFIDECFNNGYNNVDYNLSTKMFSMTSESNYMPQSIMDNQYITNKCDKQFRTIKQLRNDTADYSYKNEFCKNNTNVLLRRAHNDLLQEQYIDSENNTSFQKIDNITVLSDHQSYHKKTNFINKPNYDQINIPSNIYDSLIKNLENSKYSIYVCKNEKNVKDKRKKLKINKVSNMQINGNEIAFKSKSAKSKALFLSNQFKDNERELFEKYKQSERNFRKFSKLMIKNRIPQVIKRLKISNLPTNLKLKTILTLTSLSHFLNTINSIHIKIERKSIQIFLSSLDLAYEKISKYADIPTKLLIFKSNFNDLHMVGNKFICQANFDVYKIECLLIYINERFNSFQRKLIKLRDIFEQRDIYN